MTTTLRAALLAVLLTAFAGPNAGATSRIKDLANIEGVRQNQLIGYGLVVGLNGTGDTLNNIPFTKQSLTAMLERLGVNIRGQTLRTGNVAAVMVTANLPPFGTQGTRIDITVSSLGDAKSLQGGMLLVTPCSAPTATSTRSARVRWRFVRRPAASQCWAGAQSAAPPDRENPRARSRRHGRGRSCAGLPSSVR
jgi:hypothetical protein